MGRCTRQEAWVRGCGALDATEQLEAQREGGFAVGRPPASQTGMAAGARWTQRVLVVLGWNPEHALMLEQRQVVAQLQALGQKPALGAVVQSAAQCRLQTLLGPAERCRVRVRAQMHCSVLVATAHLEGQHDGGSVARRHSTDQ